MSKTELPLKLTIAIPTFNRQEKALQSCLTLLTQLNSLVELVIIDNHSSPSVEEYFLKYLSSESSNRIRYVRNATNVGGSSNLMRCIEFSRAEFVWMLGDDDAVLPNAVGTILETLKKYPEAGVLNFYSPSPSHRSRLLEVQAYSVEQYIQTTGSIGDLIFMSGLVFNTKAAQRHLFIALHWGSTCASQFVTSVEVIREGYSAVVLPDSLIQIIGDESKSIPTSTLYLFCVSGLHLLHYPWEKREYDSMLEIVSGQWYFNMRMWLAIRLLHEYAHSKIDIWKTRYQLTIALQLPFILNIKSIVLAIVKSLSLMISFFPKPVIRWILTPLEKRWKDRF